MAATVNILSLGWLSKYIRQRAAGGELPAIEDNHYVKVIESMSEHFRETNSRAFQLGKLLYDEAPATLHN